MIIPVRCFTCNNIIGSKYNKYLELIKVHNELNSEKSQILTANPNVEEELVNSRAKIFLDLGLKRYCCRRHLLSHVDLINKI